MKEVFKKIDGFDNYYVSTLGRIKSTQRVEPIILRLGKNRLGYTTIQLWDKNKRKLTVYHVSRLVLSTFLGYPADPWLCYAHHKNGNLDDCRLENLEWIICETTDEYDPKKSHRKGVLKPKETKNRMTDAKYHQSKETIEKQQESRKKTMEKKKS